MPELNPNAIIVIAAIAALYGWYLINSQRKKRLVKAALAEGARVIDVRSPAEYGSGHYQGAVNIPHDKIADRLKAVGAKDQSIVLYCASGARSGMAAQLLKAKGYTKVVNAGRYAAMPV